MDETSSQTRLELPCSKPPSCTIGGGSGVDVAVGFGMGVEIGMEVGVGGANGERDISCTPASVLTYSLEPSEVARATLAVSKSGLSAITA